jgi:hypothetical protein
VEVRLLRRVAHGGPESFTGAQHAVGAWHYLEKPVDPRARPEAWGIYLTAVPGELAGYLIVGWPEATRCYAPADAAVAALERDVPLVLAPRVRAREVRRRLGELPGWYGSVADVAAGRAVVSRWQVLNLARVWLFPRFQAGGAYHWRELLPGFVDRRGRWRSALGSAALRALVGAVGAGYLCTRPPCFLGEPYEVRWLLSYCDTRIHRGTLYAAAGWELYRTNSEGIQTWRTPLPALSAAEDAAVRSAAAVNPRSQAHRERRSQLALEV